MLVGVIYPGEKRLPHIAGESKFHPGLTEWGCLLKGGDPAEEQDFSRSSRIKPLFRPE